MVKELKFSISELIYSEKAIQHNINNMPDIKSLDCMLDLIYYCLQPLREKLGKPIIVSSGFRCNELNIIVNGEKTSQHKKGQAADISVKGMSVQALMDFIINSGIEYDQLINEYNLWVHVSFVKGKNRKQVLYYK